MEKIAVVSLQELLLHDYSSTYIAMDASAQLVRVCLAEDGRTKATFEDNSILLLNASGSAYVHCPPDGHQASCCTQLCEYAISRYAPKVAVALEFRNMHVDVPYYCSTLRRCCTSPAAQGLQLGYQLLEVWWPTTAAEAWSTGAATTLPGGSIALSSTDSSARMVLHSHGQRFAVSYPLLVGQDSHGQYQYVWQTQVFSMMCYPSRWDEAVQLLQAVAQHAAEKCGHGKVTHSNTAGDESSSLPSLSHSDSYSNAGHGENSHQQCSRGHAQTHMLQNSSITGDGSSGPDSSITQRGCEDNLQSALVLHPQQPDSNTRHAQQLDVSHHSDMQAPCTQLPDVSQQPQSCVCDGFEPGTWWYEPSLTQFPNSELLVMEWTPEATYQFIPTSQEVQAWVQADSSCICSEKQGRFIRHVMACQQAGPGQRGAQQAQRDMLYAASCVPEQTWCADGSQSRCPLGKLAAHLLKFREQMVSVLLSTATDRHSSVIQSRSVLGQLAGGPVDDETFLVQSEEVLESVEQPGQGSFTAYADGRVRAFFQDRTIMHLNTLHTHCKVILPDGKAVCIATSNPVGVQPYMQALLDFCRWAFTPPAEREAALHAQHMAHVQAAASQRMAQLLEWSLSRSAAGKPGGASATQIRASTMQSYAMEYRTPALHCKTGTPIGTAAGDRPLLATKLLTAGTATGRLAPEGVQSPVEAELPAGSDMQAMVQQLLRRNAELIGKL